MAARNPSPTNKSRAPGKPKARRSYVFFIGLLTIALGLTLLVMSLENKGLRPAGAVALLLGLVMAGSYLTNRLYNEAYADPLAYEPPWSKLARGTGPPRLPAPGKAAVSPGTAFSMEKLIDFPAAAPPRRADPPARSMPVHVPPAPVPSWTELFDRMSPQQFDSVCVALFGQSGFEPRCQSHGVPGGVTIWLHSRHAQQGKETPAAVALCKQWKGQVVDVRELYPLFVLMKARQLKRGTYATASSYTDNARQFAKDNNINALDKVGLLGLIAGRTPAQQQALLALALANT
jgi:restriction system protein